MQLFARTDGPTALVMQAAVSFSNHCYDDDPMNARAPCLAQYQLCLPIGNPPTRSSRDVGLR